MDFVILRFSVFSVVMDLLGYVVEPHCVVNHRYLLLLVSLNICISGKLRNGSQPYQKEKDDQHVDRRVSALTIAKRLI